MKKIKAPQKLRLNKNTVRNLSADETRDVQGGSILLCSGAFCAPRVTGYAFCTNVSLIMPDAC